MKKLIIVLVVVICLMPFGVFGDDFYTETLGKAARDIQNVQNAGDCSRIESYLRDAEKQCVKDPKCDRRTLDMLNKAIDAVQRMYR
jgi:hypothetical protein